MHLKEIFFSHKNNSSENTYYYIHIPNLPKRIYCIKNIIHKYLVKVVLKNVLVYSNDRNMYTVIRRGIYSAMKLSKK